MFFTTKAKILAKGQRFQVDYAYYLESWERLAGSAIFSTEVDAVLFKALLIGDISLAKRAIAYGATALTRTIEEYNVIAALPDTTEVIEFLLDYYPPFKMLPYPIVGATLYAARSAAVHLNSDAKALSSVASVARPHNSAESTARTGVGSIRFKYKTVDEFVSSTRNPPEWYYNAVASAPEILECKSVDDFVFLKPRSSVSYSLTSDNIGISKYLTRYLSQCSAMMERHLGQQYSDTQESFYQAMFAETKEKIKEEIKVVLPEALAKIVADYEEEMPPLLADINSIELGNGKQNSEILTRLVRKRYYKYYERAKELRGLHESIQEDKRQRETNIKILKSIALAPTITNAAVGLVRTAMVPNLKNAVETALSASHLYSIHHQFKYYNGATLAVNFGMHISTKEYSAAFNDLFMTLIFRAIKQSATDGEFRVFSGIIFLYTFSNAIYNLWSLYSEWGTNKFLLQSATAWKDLTDKVMGWNLPIVSEFAQVVNEYNVQKISNIGVSIGLSTAEYNIRAQLTNEELKSLKINPVQVPFNGQSHHCLEIDSGEQFEYVCYDPIEQGLYQLAMGNTTCQAVEYY